MDGKILKFARAGIDAFKPSGEDLGKRDLCQWLGSLWVTCGCGKEHIYDIFITFDKTLRGGWRPKIHTFNERGASVSHVYGEGIASTHDEIHFRFTEDLIKEQWWVIYNREPQTDKRV